MINHLKSELAHLVHDAEAALDTPVRLALTAGLRLDIRITKITLVQLSHQTQEPTPAQLKLIIDQLPYPVDFSRLALGTMYYHRRHYLTAHWPTPPRLPLDQTADTNPATPNLES